MPNQIYTTLNKIRAHSPCESSWVELLDGLGKTKADDDPLAMLKILDILNLDDCLWATRSLPEHDKLWRLLACDFAERVLPIFEKAHPDDSRPRDCIAVARRFAVGDATDDELDAACAAASAAWDVAWAARDAAWAAASAASAARAAWAAASAASAARAASAASAARAAWAAWAAGAAGAARDAWAARDAAWAAWAARDDFNKWSESRLRECLAAGEYVEADHA